MRTRRTEPLALAAGLAATLAFAAPAAAVRVTCGTGAGMAGQNVDIAVTTTSVSGLNVRSFQFEVTYDANLVTATDVLEAGSQVAAAGWGDATFHVTTGGATGRIAVAHVGATALSGAGTLLTLRFLVNPAQLAASSTTLAFATFTFNEGAPPDTTANGSLTIQATQIIAVSPNTGELIRGQTLPFTVSGSVTPPVTWSTTDPGVATISATGVLTALAPGAVRVTALDNAGRTDQSDGAILVRGMGLTAGTVSGVVVGQPVSLPLTVSSLTGLGIRAGQVTLTFSANVLSPTGVSTLPGTLLNGYGPVGFGSGSGTCSLDFAGSNDLNGSGVLCYVNFSTLAAGFSSITVVTALFNETLPARTTNGSVNVSGLPTITVSPENVALLAGQTRQFSVSGSPTLPITWSTLDPAVAGINATGLLTALSGGTTRVRAVDNVGATDENTSVTVYDFTASLPTVVAPPGATIRMDLASDRTLGALDIRSLQYRLTYSSAWITDVLARASGLVGIWGAGGIVTQETPGQLLAAEAGSNPLPGGSTTIQVLEFDLSPAVPVGTNLPITLSDFLCNEGHPAAQVTSGQIQVRTGVDITGHRALAFGLEPPTPNPSGGTCWLRFVIPEERGASAPVTLAVYGLDGRRVRTLVSERLDPGEHAAHWDGSDENGSAAAAGLYFVRLEWGGREVARRIARIH